MDVMGTLVQTVVSMTAMMAVGFVLYRRRLVDNDGVAQISNVVLFVASPSVVMLSFARDFDLQRLVDGGVGSLAFALITVASAVVALVLLPRDRLGQFGVVFTNVGFIGIPIVQSVLGQDYVFFISVAIAVNVFAIWTYGVWLVSSDMSQVSLCKVLANPNVIAIILGLVLFVAPITLPVWLSSALTAMGNLNTGLAMVVLGAYVAQTDVRSLLRDRRIYYTCFLRLIVVPLASALLLSLFPLSTEVRLVMLIGAAAPTGALAAMLSRLYGGDYRYAAGLVSVSTIFSMVTLPLVTAVALPIL